MNLSSIADQFQRQLFYEYHENRLHILDCFLMYIGFLIQFANPRYDPKPLGQFTRWQIEDMKMSLYNPKINVKREILETFWLYTRRGGKTRGMTVVCIFLALLGYMGMWRASFTDQLHMAKYWFLKNPFVLKVSYGQTDNRVVIMNSPDISFDVIAPGKTQSRGVDFIGLDEECMIVAGSKKYDVYEKLRPSLADSTFKHFMHGSTPEVDTVAETNYLFLKDEEIRKQTQLVAEHPWQDCHWITAEFIETERLLHADDPYYVALQYELEWTVLGGKVFKNIIRVGDPQYPMFPIGYLDSIKPTHGGVDFNGDINKHYLGTIAYNDSFIFALDEFQFDDLNFLLEWHKDKEHVSLELEDGMYNTQFTDDTKEMGLKCNYNMNWTGDKGGDKKMLRVQKARARKIIINKARTPKLYDNLNSCSWNRHKLRTEIRKTKDQHGLDWLLHALHEASGDISIPNRGKQRKMRKRFEFS